LMEEVGSRQLKATAYRIGFRLSDVNDGREVMSREREALYD